MARRKLPLTDSDLDELHNILGRLYDIRIGAGLSQRKLARRMRTQQSAISDLETGQTSPEVATLMRYARSVGYRLSFVLEPVPSWTEEDVQTLEAQEVEMDIEVGERFKVYTVRLPGDALANIYRLAEKNNIPPSTMVRHWILERLQEELKDD